VSDEAQELFLDALEVGDDARDAWLAARCGDRPALVAEVQALLDADRVAEGFLDPPVADTIPDERGRWLEGRAIGSYTIVRRIGVGGMGTVYEAMQQRPRRRVALKLLRCGLVSPELRRRFEQEAEILGRLRHPAIAGIYEAGTYDSELGPIPYFALEFIEDAKTLGAWVTGADLDAAAIVPLVVEIAEAIGHAHAAHVVHRDIKPSNILVGRDGRPRLIDFGVARATDDESRRITLATAVGELVGTLHYMSPEQCSFDGAEIDGRADVYSLGVVLYELLAGRLPYPIDGVAPAMVPELVRTHVPAPPLRDRQRWADLDAVVLTALEKDPRHRYATAEAFAEDLRRALRGEPVHARRSRRRVRLRRLWWHGRRALPVGVLAAGVGLGAWSLGRESPAIDRAVEPAATTPSSDGDRERHRHRIAIAERARDQGDLALAKRALQECPPDERGWEWWRLRAQLDGSVAHAPLDAPVDAVAYDAVGHRVLALTELGTLAMFEADVAAGRLVERWRVATDDRYLTLAVDAALRRVYVAGDRGVIHTYAIEDGAVLEDFGPGRSIWGVAIVEAPHGVLVTRTDGSLERWSLPTPQRRSTAVLGQRFGRTATFDERWVAALDDGAVLGDTTTGAVLRRLDVGARPEAVMIDALGIAVGGWDGDLWRFDADGTARPAAAALPAAILDIERVDDTTLAIAGADGVIRLWDRDAARTVAELRGHDFGVRALAIDPDGGALVSGSTDQSLRLWDPRRGPLDTVFVGAAEKIHALAWSTDGALLFTGSGVEWDRSAANELVAWSVDTGSAVARVRDHAATIEAVIVAGAAVVSADRDGTLVVRDAGLTPRVRVRAHPGRIHALAVSPGGDVIASAGEDGTVATWRLDDGAPIARIDPTIGAVRAIAWDGDALVAAGERGVARWIDGTTAITTLAPEAGTALAIGPGGERFVGDARGMLIRLGDGGWRVDTLGRTIHALSLVADGSRLAVASDDGRVRLVDPRDGAVVSTVGSHEFPVMAVAFSPDGGALASGGFDLQARIWRAPRP
jgi:WD40 repeat protein